jgi:XrtJ-associated TM-motif-TM protein
MKLALTALTALVLIALATTAHAQGGTVSSGCGASPENPTALLALVGSAGATLTALRQRRRNK